MSREERDAVWWEVQRRCSRTPDLTERLHPYLIGIADFPSAALDALEQYAVDCSELEDEGMYADHVGDQDEACKTAAFGALARYSQGEPAARVLVDLLNEILGAQELAALPRVRLTAQCETLRSQLEQRTVERDKLTVQIDTTAQELAALETALAQTDAKPPSA